MTVPPDRREPDPGGDDVDLGDLLREARTSRGLTLAEVERDTRISRSYLEALEGGRYEVLPAPVYARGFVRSYARYLGLDEQEAVSLLPDDMPRPAGLEPLPGLRRTRGMELPTLNAPIALGVVAVAVALLLLVFLVPRIFGGGEAGVAEPDTAPGLTETAAGAPTTAAPPAEIAPSVATVPPFEVGEAPNFIGVNRETAEAMLDQLGLRAVVIEGTNEAPAGQVFDQSPQPGAPIESGDDVTLNVSTGPSGGQ